MRSWPLLLMLHACGATEPFDPPAVAVPAIEPLTVRTYPPRTWNDPALAEPTVVVRAASSAFRRRGYDAADEDLLVADVGLDAAWRFDELRTFSRTRFAVSGDAYAALWQTFAKSSWRWWMVVRGDQRFQVYEVPDRGGWEIRRVTGGGDIEKLRELCFDCLPKQHRRSDAAGPAFLDNGSLLRWHPIAFTDVPFATFLALYRTLARSFGDYTLTREVEFPRSRIKTEDRPNCTVGIRHRVRWILDRYAPKVEVEILEVGTERCCAPQRFTGRHPHPLCVERAVTSA